MGFIFLIWLSKENCALKLSDALENRKAAFLATDNWAAITNRLSSKSYREQLLDILLQIPGVLELWDQMKHLQLEEIIGDELCAVAHYSQSYPLSHVRELLRMTNYLFQNLGKWLESLQLAEQAPLWAYSEHINLSTHMRPTTFHGRVTYQPTTIHFPNPKIPGLIINYWAGLLELGNLIVDVRNMFCYKTTPPISDLLAVDCPSASITSGSLTQLALDISQTAMLLCSSIEGCTMADTPLRLAERHLKRVLSGVSRYAETDINPLRDYDAAELGLLCNKRATAMMQNALQNYH